MNVAGGGKGSGAKVGQTGRGAAVGVIAVTLGASYLLDKVSNQLPDLTVLYLVPVSVAVYFFGLPVGVGVTLAALMAHGFAHPAAHWPVLASDVVLHFAVFFLVAVLVDRLRRQLQVIRELEALRDIDLSIAREVEQSMLDSPPITDDRFDISVTLRFAREVGGDYYRLSQLDDGVFACVGDISGKGVSAALLIALLNESIGDGLVANDGLAALAETVNARIYASTMPQMFVTMFLAVLSEGCVTYINAGHVRPLLFDARTGEITELAQAGTLPLGVAQHLEVCPASVPFTSGDMLLVCTDGITESSAVFREPGLLGSTLKSSAPDGTERVVEQVAKLAEVGNARSDDVTVMAIQRRS